MPDMTTLLQDPELLTALVYCVVDVCWCGVLSVWGVDVWWCSCVVLIFVTAWCGRFHGRHARDARHDHSATGP